MGHNIQIATKIAWSYLGRPYIWGGDDPIKGFDCSGFVIEILKSVGKLPRDNNWDTTAKGLYKIFKKIEEVPPEEDPWVEEGMLVFWHSKNDRRNIIHVEYCINHELSIGASGGGSKTKTIENAISSNAFIKIRPFESRPNIHGFVDPFSGER